MKVWIRADGNEQIGTGHVMRCLAIAEALEAAGVPVCFVMADGAAAQLVKKTEAKRQGSCIPGMTAWRRNCLY